MKKIKISEVLKFTPLEILNGIRGKFIVLFDDGKQVEMNHMEIVINRYIWELNKRFLGGLTKSNSSIKTRYKNDVYTAKHFSAVVSDITREIMDEIYDSGRFDKMAMNPVRQLFIDIIDGLHNELGYKLVKYSLVIDSDDLMDLQLDDGLVKSIMFVKKVPNGTTINNAYDSIKSYMDNNPTKHLSIMYKSGILKPAQINILAGPRGGISEINGLKFREVITNSFMLGMNKKTWQFQESRTLARSNIQSIRAIQESDKLTRSMRIITSILSTLTFDDCGSERYKEVLIPLNPIDKNRGDRLLNRYYLNEENNQIELFTKAHVKMLEGKIIKFRTPLHCRNHNKHTCCITCFGKVGLNLPYALNVGHTSVSKIGKLVTQGHLSIKHHMASILATLGLEISRHMSDFFYVNNEESFLGFKHVSGKKKKWSVSFHSTSLHTTTVSETVMEKVDALSSSTISILTFDSVLHDGDIETPISSDNVMIEKDGKTGYFTNEFLVYMVNNVNLNRKTYTVDMSSWDNSKPFMKILDKDYDFMELTNQMKKFLLNSKKAQDENIFLNLDNLERKMVSVINDKLNIDENWIEILCYAFTRQENNGLPERDREDEIVESSSILGWRSFAPSSSHDDFNAKISNPILFFPEKMGVNNSMDIYFTPEAFFPSKENLKQSSKIKDKLL